MSNHRETMSNVDTAWLHMDRPTNLMMITSFMLFDEPLDYQRLLDVIEARLLRFDRFRQRVVEPQVPFGNAYWELDPHFDIRAHARRVGLPAPGDKTALQNMISDIMSTPLDRTKPLWQFQLIEGYDGGSVVAARLHHSIADGIALMQVLLSLTDDSPDPIPAASATGTDVEGAGKSKGLIGTLMSPAASMARSTQRLAGTAARQGYQTFRHPGRVVDFAKVGASSAATLTKMALRWPDPPTIFKGDLGVTKRAAWSEPFPLVEVKAVGKALGGTVNDVLLTAVSGALRRYMLDRGQANNIRDFRALVPVNLRPPDEPLTLGNKFGLYFLALPVSIDSPQGRFIALKRRMDELKNTPEAVVALGVLYAMGMAPTDIEELFVRFFGSKSTAVMTNVPGPQKTLYLAGKPIRGLMGWVPQSGRLGLGVSILSYNGGVMIGVATDAGHVPDPERIVAHLDQEFDELKDLAARKGEQ